MIWTVEYHERICYARISRKMSEDQEKITEPIITTLDFNVQYSKVTLPSSTVHCITEPKWKKKMGYNTEEENLTYYVAQYK